MADLSRTGWCFSHPKRNRDWHQRLFLAHKTLLLTAFGKNGDARPVVPFELLLPGSPVSKKSDWSALSAINRTFIQSPPKFLSFFDRASFENEVIETDL